MTKFNKILQKAHQFAKMAENAQKEYSKKFAQINSAPDQESRLLLEPAVLFKHVALLKQTLLSAVANVRSVNDEVRDLSLDKSNKNEYEFVNLYGRNFIKACYEAFPDLDGAIKAQDPRQLHVLKAEAAVNSLSIVVDKVQALQCSNATKMGLKGQLEQSKASLNKIREFQQSKSKWNISETSNQDRAFTGVSDLEPDWMKGVENKNTNMDLEHMKKTNPESTIGKLRKLNPDKKETLDKPSS